MSFYHILSKPDVTLASDLLTFKTAISANKALDIAARFMLSALARIFAVADGAFFSCGTWY